MELFLVKLIFSWNLTQYAFAKVGNQEALDTTGNN